uniref:protein-tyrosine-phosphatase n=1 Tax=Arcella intermedia TaxID=1963864 RepID=A0A6B2LCI2_9EUKA
MSALTIVIAPGEAIDEKALMERIEPVNYGKPLLSMREEYIVVVYDSGDRSSDIIYELLARDGKTKSLHQLRGGFSEFDKKYKRLSYSAACMTYPEILEPPSKVSYTDAPPSEIVDGILFLGNELNARNIQQLKNCNIQFIVNCTLECENYFPEDFEYFRVSVDDTSDYNLLDYFEETFLKIDKAIANKCPVLIHCHQGVSRGPTFTIAYLVYSKHMNLNDAFHRVLERRPIVLPNRTFFWALVEYEKKITGSISFPLKRYYAYYGNHEIDIIPRIILNYYPTKTPLLMDQEQN